MGCSRVAASPCHRVYATDLGDAIALAELLGRSEVLDELEEASFAEPTIGMVDFKEMQDFMRQKVSLPTKTWTETLHRAHDRAFVVAGADSVALVEDLRAALDKAMFSGGGLEGFRADFDAIIERAGWQYNGGRNWRTRVIYETNLRTAHQAGRLKQMRDPDVVKLRPYWRYVHGEIRVPAKPRPEHLAWDGKVFMHDDPIWDVIYPPNGWRCSCGVGTVSKAGLKRLGKTGPDTPPRLKMRKVKDPTTGDTVQVPEGIDFGWGYAPGNTWEQGLVPREFQKPLALEEPELPLPVQPDLDELSRSFKSDTLPDGEGLEFYLGQFFEAFDTDLKRSVLYRDQAEHALVISDQLFKNEEGLWKGMKRERQRHMRRFAETIQDPDEIWVNWQTVDKTGEVRLIRNYLRWDPDLAALVIFKWSPRGWEGVTTYDPRAGKQNKPRKKGLDKQRTGVLIYRRET